MGNISMGEVAGALLGQVEDTALVDFLLQRAGDTRSTRLLAGPSKQAAMRHVRGKDLSKVLLIAACAQTDAEALAKFARDPRVNVRRMLVGNASTPYESVLYLAQWAHTKGDESMGKAAARLNAADIVDVMGACEFIRNNQVRGYGYPWQVIAGKIVSTGDEALIKRAYKIGNQNLADAIAVKVYESGKMSLGGIVEAHTDLQQAAVYTLGKGSNLCTPELAELMVKHIKGMNMGRHRFALLGDEAGATLLGAGDEQLAATAILSGMQGKLVDQALRGKTAAWYNVLVELLKRGGHTRLTPRQEQIIGRGLLHDPKTNADMVMGFLAFTQSVLPSAMIMGLLRKSSSGVTAAWAAGRYATKPRGGELTALVENPERALDAYRGYRNQAATSNADTAWSVLSGSCGEIIAQPWGDEFASIAGVNVLLNLRYNATVAKWLAGRFKRAFADDFECWETAMSLVADWTDGVDELISSTLVLNGKDELVETEPVPVVEDEQLVLL